MGNRSIPPGTQEHFVRLRTRKGYSRAQAAKAVGISAPTAKKWDELYGITLKSDLDVVAQRGRSLRPDPVPVGADTAVRQLLMGSAEVAPDPIPLDRLSPEAARGLEDIAYFAQRYFGAILMPFHVETVAEIKRRLETPFEEYLLMNICPGAGKSFFKRIVAAWLTCQDRTFRGLMGSATQTLATKDVDALRTAFERPQPQMASLQAVRHGIAVNAEACLSADYGRFAPNSDEPNIWRADGFRVAQHSGVAVSDKDLTWLAVGFDTKYIGTRVNGAFWDDPHDKAKMRTLEGREKMQEDWSEVGETRLETGGLLWLIQQRLGPGDLTSYAREQMTAGDEDDAEDRPVYHQIRFKAHYEEKCEGDHGADAKPWPDGCLLFPKKIHWRKIQKESRKTSFQVVYQQEDVDPAEALVKPVWVSGGRDPDTGEEHPGCWDMEREVAEVPAGISAPWLSVVTIDPSPTRFWALQWWLYHPASQNRYLIDQERRTLSADELIDRDFATGEFTGLMPDWQRRSVSVGMPITHWVYERNAAQRFILKFNHVQDWQRQNSVSILSHDTHAANKNAPEEAYGVWCVGPHWRFGRVRLPGRPHARIKVMQLVSEALAYPQGTTDDCVMAEWIFEWNLNKLVSPPVEHTAYNRPGFVPDRWKPRLKVVA